jgi:20S proteasome alpha/beta subunit
MTQERKYLATAGEAGQFALTSLEDAIDILLAKEDPVRVIHEALHRVMEARDAVEVVLGALRRLERFQQVERLEPSEGR